MPRERIAPDFVQRAMDPQAAQEPNPPPPGPPPTLSKSIGKLLEKLRRSIGLGT